jgi:hypothetical protein
MEVSTTLKLMSNGRDENFIMFVREQNHVFEGDASHSDRYQKLIVLCEEFTW